MNLFITADHNVESGLTQVIVDIYRAGYDKFFEVKNYGGGLSGIGIVLTCRNPALHFKRRIRFSKKNKRLSMDVMLDLDEMKSLTHEERRQLVVKRLAKEVPEIVTKYQIPDFNVDQFINDLTMWLDKLGWK
jgi:hypothetical protein